MFLRGNCSTWVRTYINARARAHGRTRSRSNVEAMEFEKRVQRSTAGWSRKPQGKARGPTIGKQRCWWSALAGRKNGDAKVPFEDSYFPRSHGCHTSSAILRLSLHCGNHNYTCGCLLIALSSLDPAVHAFPILRESSLLFFYVLERNVPTRTFATEIGFSYDRNELPILLGIFFFLFHRVYRKVFLSFRRGILKIRPRREESFDID